VQTAFCILSLGMGVESTAILVRWLTEPATRPCPLDKLIVCIPPGKAILFVGYL
jgi:hypothetical protein